MEKNFSSKVSSKRFESISLGTWFDSFRNDTEMREIFLNMDRAMRYIHDRGYCISSFDPKKIEILNNSVDQIKFDYLEPLPADPVMRSKAVKDDIYNSAFVQVGLYSNCLYYLKKDFLKDNFDKFTTFIPEGDVPYYRGVICRNAPVYFCEYATEKASRDLADLENSLKELGEQNNLPVAKPKTYDLGVNDSINDRIYPSISGLRDSAFVSAMMFPVVLFVIGIIGVVLLLLFNLVG